MELHEWGYQCSLNEQHLICSGGGPLEDMHLWRTFLLPLELTYNSRNGPTNQPYTSPMANQCHSHGQLHTVPPCYSSYCLHASLSILTVGICFIACSCVFFSTAQLSVSSFNWQSSLHDSYLFAINITACGVNWSPFELLSAVCGNLY